MAVPTIEWSATTQFELHAAQKQRRIISACVADRLGGMSPLAMASIMLRVVRLAMATHVQYVSGGRAIGVEADSQGEGSYLRRERTDVYRLGRPSRMRSQYTPGRRRELAVESAPKRDCRPTAPTAVHALVHLSAGRADAHDPV